MTEFRQLAICLFISICVIPAGCSSKDADTAARQQYWTDELERNAPVGTEASVVLDWLTNQNIDYRIAELGGKFGGHKKYVLATLEHIKYKSNPVCSDWIIRATIHIDDNGKVSEASVDGIGNCL